MGGCVLLIVGEGGANRSDAVPSEGVRKFSLRSESDG
jgi:hypothetical protein